MIVDVTASFWSYYVHGDGGEMTIKSKEYRSDNTAQEMLDGGGLVILTDAPVQRIKLNIEWMDAPCEESLRSYFFDGGWTVSEEISVPMSGDIYLRDDTRDDGTTHLGHSNGIIRARVCVGRMGGDRQAFGYDNWLPQEHFIRLWLEPEIREPLRLTRTPTTPIPDGEVL